MRYNTPHAVVFGSPNKNRENVVLNNIPCYILLGRISYVSNNIMVFCGLKNNVSLYCNGGIYPL